MTSKTVAAFAASTAALSYPAWAGSDNPGIEYSGESGLVGLVVLVLIYGAWRLFVGGELWSLISTVTRFLASIYVPLLVFVGAMLTLTAVLRSTGMDKETAGVIALVASVVCAVVGMNLWAGKRSPGEGKPGE